MKAYVFKAINKFTIIKKYQTYNLKLKIQVEFSVQC